MRVTRWIAFGSLATVLGAWGCATGTGGPSVGAADVPRLEAAVEASPRDTDLRTRLGVAYFHAGEHEAARDALTQAVSDGSTSGTTYLFLGLANEELEAWDEAREAYTAYLQVADDPDMEERIRGRLALVGRRALQAEARMALQREEELTQAEPTPRSVAVFPFRLFSDRPELEPLEVALADMMTTDLQLSGGLVVLERSQVQTLLDEMALTEAGVTEEGTGARAGRLLRAEHVVQGALTTLEGEQLRLDADVLQTQRRQTVGQVEGQDLLEQIFELEKEAVLEVIDVLGVDLTPAEREAINENRAANLLALLAYGRGLMALDEGDFGAAQQHFQQSLQHDPSFGAAQTRADEAAAMESAAESSPTQTAQAADDGGTTTATTQGGDDGLAGDITDGINGSPGTAMVGPDPTGGTGSDPQTGDRDPTSEATQTEGQTETTAEVNVRIPNPAGGGGQ